MESERQKQEETKTDIEQVEIHVEPKSAGETENKDSSSSEQQILEDKLKKKLEKHFNDPFTKICSESGWKKIPEKFMALLLVLGFCTSQLVSFASDRTQFAGFLERNEIAMKHLLLKDWARDFETMPYPPVTGVYAIYTIDELLNHINHTVKNVYTIPTTSVGSFFIRRTNGSNSEEKPVKLCLNYFLVGIFNESSEKIQQIDPTIKTDCNDIAEDSPEDFGFDPSIYELMRSTEGKLVRLLNADVYFKLSSIQLNPVTKKSAQCFGIQGSVHFDNTDINGQITVKLQTSIEEVKCNSDKTTDQAHSPGIAIVVIIISILHGVFCFYGCVSPGCLYKVQSQSIIAMYDDTGILLGLGCSLTWLSLSHYLAFDHVFGLLFSVIERSASAVLKFLVCASLLFSAFALCGWTVLGPYHIKFASFASTVESLLALVNGDEIYVTFTAVDSEKESVWFFNRSFLVVFIALFTLMTLNIFIAMFTAAYEHQQDEEYKRQHRSDLLKFLGRDAIRTCDIPTCVNCVENSCPRLLGCMACCNKEKIKAREQMNA